MGVGEFGVRRVTLVPRTHFDLAWWAKWTIFRHLFEQTFGAVVPALEADPGLRFTLDSQTELALWWLEGSELPAERQHRRDRLRRLVESGQLQVGPGMVLPDLFLTDPELIIDNLVLGERIGGQLGVPPAAAIDCSDIFGYPAELPKVLAEFGHRVLLLTRGVPPELADEPAFWWVAEDRSPVLVLVQLGGYDSGRQFARAGTGRSTALVGRMLRRYGPHLARVGLDDLLIYVGTDHSGLRPDVPAHLAACRRRFPGVEFRLATNEEYVRDLPVDRLRLRTWSGELVGTVTQDRPLLRGVSSSRMYLKQANERVVRLVRQAQRASALAVLRGPAGFAYPHEAFTGLLRRLLVSQSHDALTGCGVDAVARDMLAVYDDLAVAANRLLQEALGALAGRRAAYGNGFQYGQPPMRRFSLWNPLPYPTTQVAVLPLPVELHGDDPLAGRRVQRVGTDRVAVQVALPGFGSTQVTLRRARFGRPTPPPHAADRIGNGLLQLSADANGRLTLHDLTTGKTLPDLLRFRSVGDRGDLYNADPTGPATTTGRATIRRLANGPLVWELETSTELRLPAGLDPGVPHQWLRWAKIGLDWAIPRSPLPARRAYRRERTAPLRQTVVLPIRTVLRLTAGSRLVECETTVNNRADDHRLRVVFPLGRSVSHSRAESTFGHQTYPIQPTDPNWKATTTWMEPPFNTHVSQGWVSAGPLTVFGRGLPEFELTGPELELTLLRCVGRLSKDNLTTRRAGAGPPEPTPEAQCPGRHTFQYAILFGDNENEVALTRSAQAWRNGLVPGPAGLNTNGILACADKHTVFSTLAGATQGPGVLYRAWTAAKPADLALDTTCPHRRVTLRETPTDATHHLSPNQLATFHLTPPSPVA